MRATMAHVKGIPAGYLREELLRKANRPLAIIIGAAAASGFVGGLVFASGNILWAIGLALPFAALLWVRLSGLRTFTEDTEDTIKGARGEVYTAAHLDLLPDSYQVFHDVKADQGNLDHVVVGPTGVFAVETKNWAAVVTRDNGGELLHNNRPTDKRNVGYLKSRIRWLKAAIKREDLFVYGLVVFPRADLQTDADERKDTVDCLLLKDLCQHIQGKPNQLSRQEVTQIAAFLDSLVTSDREDD